MKAEVIDNTPHGYDVVIHYENESCIIHEGMYHKGYAKKYADDFNSALSAHVSKETAPILAEIDRLKKENKKLIRELKAQRELYIEVYEDRRRIIKNLPYDD